MPARHDPKPVALWTDARHLLGHEGEERAAEHLARGGWCVEARRFRLGHHDIDLIIRRGRLVAFVEVKTRRSHRFGSPLEGLGWRQRRAQGRVAQAWVARHGRPGDTYRFDLVVVDFAAEGGEPAIVHVPDAWWSER